MRRMLRYVRVGNKHTLSQSEADRQMSRKLGTHTYKQIGKKRNLDTHPHTNMHANTHTNTHMHGYMFILSDRQTDRWTQTSSPLQDCVFWL